MELNLRSMRNRLAVNAGAMQLDGKVVSCGNSLNALTSFRGHWPEYLMEADELGLYMFLTCLFDFVWFGIRRRHSNLLVGLVSRRIAMGLGNGGNDDCDNYVTWGKQIRVSRSLLFAAAEVFVREPV